MSRSLLVARWLMRRELRRLERAIDGPFDPVVSLRIDALDLALSALDAYAAAREVEA